MTLMPPFHCLRPATAAEAARLLADHPGAVPLAGGTDLLVNLRRGLGTPPALVDLGAIAGFAAIAEEGEGLRLGAGLTLADLAENPAIRARHPALADAALAVAGPTHRASATLGGNLCQDTRCIFYNQSEWWREGNNWCLKYRGSNCHVVPKNDRCYATYHGDVAPVLMVLGAEAEIVGPQGMRRQPVAGLFRESGADHLTLAPGDVLTAILLPPQAGWVAGYAKLRVRESVDFPLAGIACAVQRDGDRLAGLRMAITGTNSAPLAVVADLAGAAWDDAAAQVLVAAIRKTANVLKTTSVGPKYRRRVLLAAARRLADDLWRQAAP